jgi:uncharacterized protein (DUF433 family)
MLQVPQGRQKSTEMLDWTRCHSVSRDPEMVSGALLFSGTRVPVRALFENLADGASTNEFLEWFPGVQRAQVESVLEFLSSAIA